ncbi:MAG TPA: zinc ribbon domain-containing protein, partial [Steroidobacteraceae bacterium]|nr:zinc ribbon domain-containing protein [Steroidobacteraceae bacterium]
LEVMQKISDGPLKKCPSCKRSRLKRLISAPVFRLKGSGWYETDFKSDKEGKRNLAASADREEAKPAATTETAAAAKPDTATPPAASPAKPAATAPAESGGSRSRATKVTAAAKRAVRRTAPKPKRGKRR